MTRIKNLDIGEVIKQSGLPASTLRYYEEIGLIKSIGRQGMRRQFSGNILQHLALISLGRNAGFSLDEIADMFSANGNLQIDRGLLLVKAAELEKQIKQLSAVRDGLVHVAECQAPSHLECSKFQGLMRVAIKNPVRQQRNA